MTNVIKNKEAYLQNSEHNKIYQLKIFLSLHIPKQSHPPILLTQFNEKNLLNRTSYFAIHTREQCRSTNQFQKQKHKIDKQ